MHTKKRLAAALGLVLTGALTLSACGSSGDDETGNSGATGPAQSGAAATNAAEGSDVAAKIMVIGDFTSTIAFTEPEIVPTVKGVLRDFPNVQIETCDAKGAAASYLSCEQKAISDKVAAVVLGFSAGAQDSSLLTTAAIPVIGNGDAHSPNSYPVTESFSEYVALGAGLYNADCKKLGIVYLDGSDFLVDYIKEGFEGRGGKEVARASVAANAADLTPAVSKVTGAGAECVAVSLPPTGAAQALTALKQSGKQLLIGGISAVFSQQVIDSLKSLTDGLLLVDEQENPADDTPGIKQVAADAHAIDSKAPITQQGISSWVAARLVAAALPKVSGEVTNKSMAQALDSLRDVDMLGVIEPWSTVPLDSKTFSRIFNHYGISYIIKDGTPSRQGEFYDTSDLLTGK